MDSNQGRLFKLFDKFYFSFEGDGRVHQGDDDAVEVGVGPANGARQQIGQRQDGAGNIRPDQVSFHKQKIPSC